MLIPPSLSFLFCITQTDRPMAHLALVPEGRRRDDGELMIPNEARILGGTGGGITPFFLPNAVHQIFKWSFKAKKGRGEGEVFSSSLLLLLLPLSLAL